MDEEAREPIKIHAYTNNTQQFTFRASRTQHTDTYTKSL